MHIHIGIIGVGFMHGVEGLAIMVVCFSSVLLTLVLSLASWE